jgi:hypothetical protein
MDKVEVLIMAYNLNTRNEFERLGQAVTSRLVGWIFKSTLVGLVVLFLVSIVVTVIGLDVFGMARDPLTNRPPGAVAGLPPSSNYQQKYQPCNFPLFVTRPLLIIFPGK